MHETAVTIQSLAQAVAALANVTNSDSATKKLLNKIEELIATVKV